jgi:hypothetical protein
MNAPMDAPLSDLGEAALGSVPINRIPSAGRF